MSTTKEHWLQKYLPAIDEKGVERILIDEDYKTKIIEKLATALGASFYQYVSNPKDYSGLGQFTPYGADVPILFLPTDIGDHMQMALERQIEQLFKVRIKYTDEPFQL